MSTLLWSQLFQEPDQAALPLVLALVTRIGQDPIDLHIQQEPSMAWPHGSHKDCPGCEECCGPDWSWKTNVTEALLARFCKLHFLIG